MSDHKTTLVDFIRHGEPVGGQRIRGQSDDPLSENGWIQMWQAVRNNAGWQHVVTSPLLRCSEFAHAFARAHELPLDIEPCFKEIGFGSWEGRIPEELCRLDPQQYTHFPIDPSHFMPVDAEPVTDFVIRVQAAWENTLKTYRGQHVLVVCHAGVIRAVLGLVLGLPAEHLFLRVRVEHAGICRFMVENDGVPSLAFHSGSL